MNEDALYNLSDEELKKEVNRIKNLEQSEESKEDNLDNDSDIIRSSFEEDTLKGSDDGMMFEDKEESEPSTQSYKVKADGIEYEFTLDELQKLAPKAMNYTKKMQSIAPYRKMINAMEENSLSDADINMLIDIKKGNTEAIKSLIKTTGIDLYDLDTTEEIQYQPTEYGKSDEYLNLQEVVNEISTDNEYPRTQEVISKVLDDQSKQVIFSNPDFVRGLHVDIKTGTYDKLMPNALKKAVLDGNQKPILEYYLLAGKEYAEMLQAKGGNINPEENLVTQQKKSASLPKGRAGVKKATDYLSEEEEDLAYKKWYAKLQRSY